MHHDVNLLLTIGMGIVLAFVFGFVAARLRLPPLIGYLAAGIAMGPFTPGYVGDTALAGQLAEVGVILLMFGVGLHFSLDDLKAVRWIAVPGAVGQIVVAAAIGLGVAMAWGWTFGAGLVFGLSLSVASTVVLLKALEERGLLSGANGRIAVGWLIVEDLAMVLALVLVPAFAGALGGGTGPATTASGALLAAGLTIVKVGAFLAIMLVIGPRILPAILREVARLGSRELFTISVLAAAMGIAFLAAKLFDVSFALGAFCAGMVLSKSEFSHRAAEDTLPLQDAFAVLFFVSVGMLFDPSVLVNHPGAVIVTVLIVVVGKAAIALAIVLALGYPASTATMVSASLAQIGEFSFILAALGIGLNIMQPLGRDLILAGAILSILLNPLAFWAIKPITGWFSALPGRLAGRARRQMRLARLERVLEEQRQEIEEKSQLVRSSLTSDEVADKFPIFGRLPPAARTDLAALFVPRRASPGERVIRRGDPANEIFFIVAGEVEVSLPDRSVQLGPGEFFGEIGVLSGGARTADVTSIDYTELQTLSRSDLLLFLDTHPELTAAIGDIADIRARQNRGPAGAPQPAAP
ncbi:cation:proton antiporter [Enterovirga rhinocerotis]|uniref:Kef-type potassium/proton antiporter (CPA2 family) n=1 Tax=Enterovirga rhinocerotis TaxID=1339210 RepID=A0A4R7C7A2_9HYPH|nr:cation:proton antiporter [Enterovirga rhinocerotis]TDR93125.1 Kef-type potassium/proton antiporter (CPA2 family) [Enterovirga rhinocerotis]